MENQNMPQPCDCKNQKHVHELIGKTAVVGECRECHNHRFATVTGEAIKKGNSHIHEVKFRTDFDKEHFHEFCGKTMEAIEVGDGKHVHFIKDFTDCEDGHKHESQVMTLIDSPTDFKMYMK